MIVTVERERRMKKQKSIAFLLVMTLIMVPPMVENGQSSPTTNIEIDPEITVVSIGKFFTVDINISDAVDIYGLQFVLRYNPSILNATNVVLEVEGGHLIDRELLGVPIDGCDVVPDGVLDIYDLVAIYNAFGSTPGAPNWDPRADIDGDGDVDVGDLAHFWTAWGNTSVDILGTIFFYGLPQGAWEGGIFATVTFEAIGSGETMLDLDNAKLCSVLLEPIPHQLKDGNVQVLPLISAWASKTPAIDGIIMEEFTLRRPFEQLLWAPLEYEPFQIQPAMSENVIYVYDEWEDAAKVDIELTEPGGTPAPATLYVMNDYINLYLALEVAVISELWSLDAITFFFDNDNDGVREFGDNALTLVDSTTQSRFVDGYVDPASPYPLTEIDDHHLGGTGDGVGASKARVDLPTVTYNFEIAFPLNTFDNQHDFSLSVGASMGFNVKFDWGFGIYDAWPSEFWSEMAEIHIASPEPTGTAQLKVTDSTPEGPVPFTIDGQSSWDGSPVQTGDYHYTLSAGVPHEIELPDPYTAPLSEITYYFSHWEDDSRENPRTVILEPDSTVHIHGTYETDIQPPPSNIDLRITWIEVTQAIQDLDNSLPLVRGKTTVVRVYVDIGTYATGPFDSTVFLYALDGVSEAFLGGLRTSFSAPKFPDRGNIDHTANFLLPRSWVNHDSVWLKAFVKASSTSQLETDYDNNWMDIWRGNATFDFDATRELNIHLVPINVTWATPNLPTAQEISEQEQYLQTIFPVSKINFIHHDWWLVDAYTGNDIDDIIDDLNAVAGVYRIQRPDQMFGMLSADAAAGLNAPGSSDPLWIGGLGIAAAGGRRGSSREGVMAHEINHNLGPGDEDHPELGLWGRHAPHAPGPDNNWPYGDNCCIQEFGFDIGNNVVVDALEADLMCYCPIQTANGYGHWPHLCTDPHPAGDPTKWISPYRWQNIFNFFQISSSSSIADQPISGSSTSSLTETFQISGWVSRNGTGTIDPIFLLPALPLQPQIEGNCSIELQDSEGVILLAANFEPIFVNTEGDERDLYRFVMFLPYQNGTARVVLKWNGVEIYGVEQSMHAPTVQVLAPNGGEVWGSNVQTITWTAYDFDNDTLTYRLYYSADNGVSWTPISPAITQTSYQINASFIQGSNVALIRVAASDGLNTGQDESDAVFTVTDKPPTAMILQPENLSRFLMDDVILLRGRGTDADDRILPDSAFNWTSSLDGYLGNGTTLTAMLTPGTHQINLTVTDSKGNTASDSAVITVTLDTEITSVTLSRTVVGQGAPIQINVTAENPSRITQEFALRANVTPTASNLTYPIDTLKVTLPPGNSTTLAFTWNTTAFAYGNYTVSAAAETERATITLIDGIVFVTILGDVDGDGDVDWGDFGDFATAYGSKGPPQVPVPDGNYNIQADLDSDGDVDWRDFGDFATNYGKTV